MPDGPTSVIGGDFNGDGRRDLAATTVCCSVWVFVDNGGLLFSASEIVMNDDLADITTGDLNGDSRLDLVVTESFPSLGISNAGSVAVLLGNGDGTFNPKVEYEAGINGEYTVVVGDFTRDGALDVATGNRSFYYDEDFGQQMWDSISILEGTGTGTLTAPVTFALGTVNGEAAYRNTQHQLNTNDLDADGHVDLISSPGAILLNRVPVANRTPSVFAGPDRSYSTEDPIILNGEASDADRHWVAYTWTDESGDVVRHAPMAAPVGFQTGAPPGTYTYTLTADDGQGGVATDSVVITVPATLNGWVRLRNPRHAEQVPVDRPYRIVWDASFESMITRFDLASSVDGGRTFQAIEGCSGLSASIRQCVWQSPGPPSANAVVRIISTYDGASQFIDISQRFELVDAAGALPPGWSSRDVGAVGAAGSATFDGNTFTVTGSGADIWGSADEFHYASITMSGDFEIVARVAGVDNVNQWTKAGLMVRETLAAGSRHASVFATPTAVKGVAFQRRTTTNGASVHTSGPATAPPVWLRLSRHGNRIDAFYRLGSGAWTPIGSQTFSGLAATVQAGLAVTSHLDSRNARATFDNVLLEADPFVVEDVGAVGIPGSWSLDENGMRIEGSGADIWGTSDAFLYYYRRWFGDGTITVRVNSIENTNPWAKAGVMFRETLDPGAKHVMAIVSPGRGVAVQYRGTAGGTSANAALAVGTAPEWLRLTRAGNTFTAFRSENGSNWRTLGTATVAMGADILVGVPVMSHNNSTLATAVFNGRPVVE
jgi:regulation of enolase protein 1 (concanavalin A-like superfamily)